jgi:hypothetical protein
MPLWHNWVMKRQLALAKLPDYARSLRAENLERLRFKDAICQTLNLSALSMELVIAFGSMDELIRLQNTPYSKRIRISNAAKIRRS